MQRTWLFVKSGELILIDGDNELIVPVILSDMQLVDPEGIPFTVYVYVPKFGVPEIVTNPFIKLQEIPLYTVFAKTDVPSIITEGTVVPDPGIFKTLNMIGVIGIFEHKTWSIGPEIVSWLKVGIDGLTVIVIDWELDTLLQA